MEAAIPTGLQFIKGTPINFVEEFKKGDKVFVFEFWATWCPPCRQTIPHLTQLQKKYGQDVIIVGITNEDPSKAQTFVNQMGSQMDYTVAVDVSGSAHQGYMRKYNVNGIPAAFVVGKDCKVHWNGHPADPNFENVIQQQISVPSKPKYDPSKMSREQLAALSVKDLKSLLRAKGVNFQGLVEKSEFIDLVQKNY